VSHNPKRGESRAYILRQLLGERHGLFLKVVFRRENASEAKSLGEWRPILASDEGEFGSAGLICTGPIKSHGESHLRQEPIVGRLRNSATWSDERKPNSDLFVAAHLLLGGTLL
jgi:hypothetical protein